MIELLDINKSFIVGLKSKPILKQVNFSMLADEKVCIIGASGSGKTTLLDIIGTLLKPDGGQYFIDNQTVNFKDHSELAKIRKSKVGFVFQSFYLLPELNVWQNICLGMKGRAIGTQFHHEASELMCEIGIDHLRASFPDQLSGGERQRVAIARALVRKPSIILADEPTGNLDAETSSKVLRLLLNRPDGKKGLILVTHSNEIASKFPRVLMMQDGALKELTE